MISGTGEVGAISWILVKRWLYCFGSCLWNLLWLETFLTTSEALDVMISSLFSSFREVQRKSWSLEPRKSRLTCRLNVFEAENSGKYDVQILLNQFYVYIIQVKTIKLPFFKRELRNFENVNKRKSNCHPSRRNWKPREKETPSAEWIR